MRLLLLVGCCVALILCVSAKEIKKVPATKINNNKKHAVVKQKFSILQQRDGGAGGGGAVSVEVYKNDQNNNDNDNTNDDDGGDDDESGSDYSDGSNGKQKRTSNNNNNNQYNSNNNDNNNDYQSSSSNNNNNNKNSNEYRGDNQNNQKPDSYQGNNNNNNYQPQNSNNNNPYSSGNSHSGLAEVIPDNSQQTLAQKYTQQQGGITANAKKLPQAYGAAGSTYNNDNNIYGNNNLQSPNTQQNARQQVLLYLKLAKDFNQLDPRNNNSLFKFYDIDGPDYTASNAAYVTIQNGHDGVSAYNAAPSSSNNNNYQQNQNNNNYGQQQNEYQDNNNNKYQQDDSFVRQYTLPFVRYANNTDQPRSDASRYEGFIITKNSFTVGPTQRLLIRAKIACKVINADKNPYSSDCVANAWDDPRLAACEFGVAEASGSNLFFYFTITNTGIWANYQRIPTMNDTETGNATAQSFVAQRRVGVRPRYDSIVDGAIEIDDKQGVVNYYLNGYRVWSIYAIGVPPPEDGITVISLGQGTPMITTVSAFVFGIGGTKRLDQRDPNNINSQKRLDRVLGESLYYGVNDQFCDNNDPESSELWGQGIILDIFKLLFLRSESVSPPPAQPLPGVYGPKAAPYQSK